MPDTLIDRLLSLHSHRGDGNPTQYVNPDGPEAVAALTTLAAENERLKAALEHYADTYCEGWCHKDGRHANFEDCGGCRARAALHNTNQEGRK
jgi:hypothetical protein